MSVENIRPVVINDIFSKGYINSTGEYTMITSFTPDTRNMRITNQNTINRPGFITEASDPTILNKKIRGITSNVNLFVALNSKFKKVNLTTHNFTDIGTLAGDYDYNFVNYGKYTIMCDGTGYPFLYDGTTFLQLTSGAIESGANPQFGDTFLNGTYLCGGGTKSNVLYISRGVTAANPEYCYDWVGTGAEKLYMKGNLKGICSTLNRLYIFTDADGIQFISPQTTVSVGGLSATVTSPISGSGGNIPVSQRSIVKADDLVFFLTGNKQVKSLNYTPGVTEVQVGNVSERTSQSIKDFMDTLDDDQSQCFGYFNNISRTVHRHLKQTDMPFNNVVLVYDIINDTFFIDDNKFMGCIAYHNQKYYSGSSINTQVFQDEVGNDDDGQPINCYRYTKKINFGNQNILKAFREVGIVGQIHPLGVITVQILVDGNSEYVGYITGSGVPISGLGSVPLGGAPIGGETQPSPMEAFQKLVDKGDIRAKGYTIQVKLSSNVFGTPFLLSTMSFGVVVDSKTELSDRI